MSEPRYRRVSTQPWLLACELCGSVVSDTEQHDVFHEAFSLMAEVAVEDPSPEDAW